MADEIEVNEAPDEITEEAPDIVVAPVIVTGESEPPADYVTRAEFDAWREEHERSGHGDLRDRMAALETIVIATAAPVESEIAEEETVIETPAEEPAAEEPAEEPAASEPTRHAGFWI